MTRKPRGLRPDEEKLWRRVADTATPMDRTNAPERLLTRKPKLPAPKSTFEIPEFRVGEKADTALPRIERPTSKQPMRMDKRAFARMKRGKAMPEAQIDLHGMTASAAQTALTAFLMRAQAKGHRLVLVITGKGRTSRDNGPIPERSGVLRRHLPEWLGRQPLSAIVLQVTQAHQRHGGSGAFYVYLARRR